MDKNCTSSNMECTCKTDCMRISTITSHQHVVRKLPTACMHTSSDTISCFDKNHSVLSLLCSCRQGTRRSTSPSNSKFHQSPVKVFFTMLLLHLLLYPCSSYQTSNNKNPLLPTDETNRQDFRYFLPSLLVTAKSSSPHTSSEGDLDFQTLKVIKQWGNDTRDVLLVSGSNYVYMLNSTLALNNSKTISYIERLTWQTPIKTERECRMMGKKKYECKNFIRVIELLENGELMVCGTNAYAPACRYYKREQFNEPASGKDSTFNSETVCRDQCVVPYNPATASATLYTETDNGYQTFAAVVGEFSSNDPMILRKENPTLYSNSLWLNNPTFIKMFEYEDKIYVFFREIAKESESGNKEPMYSRVAQICKNDEGGVNVLSQQWTSFLKARLRCGKPGKNRLVLNNLTSVSDVVTVKDEYGQPIDAIFATFTTPSEWEPAAISAVCMFSLRGIQRVFEEGSFLGEFELYAKPLDDTKISPIGGSFSAQTNMRKIKRSFAVPRNEVPVPRPGSCSKRYSPDVLYFAKEHPLMYDSVEPHFSEPVFFKQNLRATQISVDNNAGEQGETMLYIGTEDGRILRVRTMLSRTEGQKSHLLEDIPVTGLCSCKNCGVLSLHVCRTSTRSRSSIPSIFAAFTNCMVQFPLLRCNLYKSSECCSVDPNCGWDGSDSTCKERTLKSSKNLESTLNEKKRLPTSCKVVKQTAEVTEVATYPYITESTQNGSKFFAQGTKSLAQAGTSSMTMMILAFAIGLALGCLFMCFIVFIKRKVQRRKQKLVVNLAVKGKSVTRIDSSRNDEEKVSESASAGGISPYFETNKPPMRPYTLETKEDNKYSLPPSPTPSDGKEELDFQNGRNNQRDVEKFCLVGSDYVDAATSEHIPLVSQSSTISQKNEETAPTLPPKQHSIQKQQNSIEPLMQQSTQPKISNPNTNNSNNNYFSANENSTKYPSPPTLPAKMLSYQPSQEPGIINTLSNTQKQLEHIRPMKPSSPVKRYQSYGGYDRGSKPMIPYKSPALLEALGRRPHSLAPPTSIQKLEDVTIPSRTSSRTPPVARSQSIVGYEELPRRRERPPSFRHNSMLSKNSKSPVPVAIPKPPESNL